MAAWLIKRRLTQNASRLAALRTELRQLDEQYEHLRNDAEDTALRSLMSETPGASGEASEARKHADAMERHRRRVLDSIGDLERRQDELLDRLSGPA